MDKKTALTTAALAALAMAAGCAHTSAHKADTVQKGECWGVNGCKATGECGGVGHGCAGQNSCKGQGWITLAKADCETKGGKFKAK
jgi:ABC-type phosphate/phosphonate transport system substrate-binding protein